MQSEGFGGWGLFGVYGLFRFTLFKAWYQMFGYISQPHGHEMWLWTSATSPHQVLPHSWRLSSPESRILLCAVTWLLNGSSLIATSRKENDRRHLPFCSIESKKPADGKWVPQLQRDPCVWLSTSGAVKPTLCLRCMLRLDVNWIGWSGIRVIQ